MQNSENSPKKGLLKRPPTNCDSCIHFVFDEGYGDEACEVELDEDEFAAYSMGQFHRCPYSMGQFHRCPYYQYRDEYISVRKQN